MYARLCDSLIAIDLSGRPPDKSAAIPPRPAPILCARRTGVYCIGTEQGRLKGLSIEGVLNDNYILHVYRDVHEYSAGEWLRGSVQVQCGGGGESPKVRLGRH